MPAVDVLFPPQCASCGSDETLPDDGVLLCQLCRTQIAPPRGPICPCCALPVPAALPTNEAGCARCRRVKFHFEKVLALGLYDKALRDTVLAMKGRGNEPLSMAMGGLLADSLSNDIMKTKPDLVLPIPMHWSKKIVRSTNQAAILANSLAGRLRLPIVEDLLFSHHKTKRQRTLSISQRKVNVRGAFEVSSSYVINGARLLLVDDVFTTGATANEAARQLRRAGADSVIVAVVSRRDNQT